MRITDTGDLWWKSAVIYCLDVETFLDADGDGVGDLEGLAQRIDYLADLGVTCLWLMPFYPSPDRDDGYDVQDYLAVDERLGDVGRMVELLRLAHDRGMRVVADLIVNHTSDRHPWFVRSRADKDPVANPYRDYYVWRADEPGDTSDQVVFPDQEDGIWTLDDTTGEWYLHHFYRHQPDLNLDHPEVVAEMLRAVGFWLELGFDGFRVDGVPFFAQEPGKEGADDVVDPHAFMRALRDFVSRRRGDAMLLGEVNLSREEQLAYFGGESADEFHLQFDFIGMQATYLSMARRDARPLAAALRERPVLHRTNQWATFLRNHDELTLDKLTDAERQEVFDAFGPEERMQVYDRGLKRRLPPMLDGDPRRVRMAYSLLFSLPGTPTLYYGEEIGMGEDLEAEGRMAVRTPMQWSAQRNGGFSSADPGQLVQRVVGDGYGPDHVNVMDQLHDPDSLLSWVRDLVRLRRACPELGWGELQVLDHDAGCAVLAHRLSLESTAVIALHNLGPDPVTVTVPVDGFGDDPRVVDLVTHEVVDPGPQVTAPLEGYGLRWLRVRPTGDLAVP